MSESFDPYRFGPQPPQLPPQQTPARPTGKQVLSASWRLLKQDRELILLPVIGGLAALVSAAILFLPGFAIGHAVTHRTQTAGWVGGVLALFAASVVGIYFQAALVVGANERADGRKPTLKRVLRRTWQLRGAVLSWAVLTTTVGLGLRILEERLGVLGKVLNFIGGLAWAIASFFAVPVVVAEGLGAVAAVKRSAAIIKQTWGTSVRTTLRLGLLQFLLLVPALATIAIGFAIIVAAGTGGAVVGTLLVVVGAVALLGLIVIFSATTTYARAMIYRYATGRPVPGIPAEIMAGAFMPRRRRRR